MIDTLIIEDEDIVELENSEGLSFDEDRREILKSIETIDIQACPGSGKTTLVAAKLILLSKKWNSGKQGICVLSHTNVAKEEIIDRLKKSKSPDAHKLLDYPHFIGTIQDFVNRYLGLPFARSLGIDVKFIDNDACVGAITNRLSRGAKFYIEKKSKYGNVLYDFQMKLVEGEITYDVPTFERPVNTPTYNSLLETREGLVREGCFFYKDMYVYAEKLIMENELVKKYIQRRFPVVLLDEMQDTGKYQDELLARIFLSGEECSVIQRFGDADQAIFNTSTNNEEINISYNSKTTAEMFRGRAVNNSYRFLDSIATTIKGLSNNKIPLISGISQHRYQERLELCRVEEGFKHAIIIYNNSNVTEVIKCFAEYVSSQFQRPDLAIVKAVGANGSEASGFTIRNYFPSYKASNDVKKFKPVMLIDSIYLIRKNIKGDLAEIIKLFHQSMVMYLRLCGGRDEDGKFYTQHTIERKLQNEKKLNDYQRYILDIIQDEEITADNWNVFVTNIDTLFDTEFDTEFSNFREEVMISPDTSSEGNSYEHSGVKVIISTIHAVKGETHDATLVLETKNHSLDISSMLPWLLDPLKRLPTQVTKLKFLKLLYVGMSRPKHLLCLSIDASKISEIQKASLVAAGWNVIILPTPANEDI